MSISSGWTKSQLEVQKGRNAHVGDYDSESVSERCVFERAEIVVRKARVSDGCPPPAGHGDAGYASWAMAHLALSKVRVAVRFS
jgi:hypothetical protein